MSVSVRVSVSGFTYLLLFLSFCRSYRSKCRRHHATIHGTAEDLVVDTYLDEVVRTLEEQGLTDEAEEVEIHQDGHWDPILEDQKVRVRVLFLVASTALTG